MDNCTVVLILISVSSEEEITCSASKVCVQEHGIHKLYCVQWKMFMSLKCNQVSAFSPTALRALSLFFCYFSCSEVMFWRWNGTWMYLIHPFFYPVPIWSKYPALLCSFIFANIYIYMDCWFFSVSSLVL